MNSKVLELLHQEGAEILSPSLMMWEKVYLSFYGMVIGMIVHVSLSDIFVPFLCVQCSEMHPFVIIVSVAFVLVFSLLSCL